MAAALATYRDTKISLRSARLLPPACACFHLRCDVAKKGRNNALKPNVP